MRRPAVKKIFLHLFFRFIIIVISIIHLGLYFFLWFWVVVNMCCDTYRSLGSVLFELTSVSLAQFGLIGGWSRRCEFLSPRCCLHPDHFLIPRSSNRRTLRTGRSWFEFTFLFTERMKVLIVIFTVLDLKICEKSFEKSVESKCTNQILQSVLTITKAWSFRFCHH